MAAERKIRIVRRIVLSLLVFDILQIVAWGILFYPSLTVWRHSVGWLVLMSWYANFVGALAALGTALVMLMEMDDDL